jgi:hypothetical protein
LPGFNVGYDVEPTAVEVLDGQSPWGVVEVCDDIAPPTHGAVTPCDPRCVAPASERSALEGAIEGAIEGVIAEADTSPAPFGAVSVAGTSPWVGVTGDIRFYTYVDSRL